MRIALITDCTHPTRNGVTRMVELTRAGLVAHGHRVVVVAPRPPNGVGTVDEPPPDLALRAWPLLPSAQLTAAPVRVGRLAGWLHDHDIEVVHTHTEGLVGAAGRAAARRLDLPWVHTLHTFYAHYLHYVRLPSPSHPWATHRLEGVLRRFLSGADRLIAPSSTAAQQLARLAPAHQVVQLPNAVPHPPAPALASAARTQLRVQLELRRQDRILLTVGRVAAEKRCRQLLTALAPQLRAHDDIRLLMIGGGGELKRLRAAVRRTGLERYVRLPGRLPYPQVRAAYDLAEVYVSASVSENDPLTLLEAAQAGLALVVRQPDLDVVVDGVSGVVAPTDDGLAREAVRLLDEPSRRLELGSGARQRVGRRSPSHHLAGLEAVYAEVVVDARRGHPLRTGVRPPVPQRRRR